MARGEKKIEPSSGPFLNTNGETLSKTTISIRKSSKEGCGTLSKTIICFGECLRRVLLKDHPPYSS